MIKKVVSQKSGENPFQFSSPLFFTSYSSMVEKVNFHYASATAA